MIEEDVHQLPKHVIERLDHLLGDKRVAARWLELPLGAPAREGDRQAAPLAADRQRVACLARRVVVDAIGDRDVVGLRDRVHLVRQRPSLRREPDRRKRALPDDHRMHELDRDVAGVERAIGERPSATSLPPLANRSAIRWQQRARRSASSSKKPRSPRCAS